MVDQYIFTWDSYINDLLGSGFVYDSAIYYNKDGKQLIKMSSTEEFGLSDDELDHLLVCFRHPDVAYRHGIVLKGERYKVILADGRSGILAKNGLLGCTVCKTSQLLIIGTHRENVKPDQCNDVIMRLGDFFTSIGKFDLPKTISLADVEST